MLGAELSNKFAEVNMELKYHIADKARTLEQESSIVQLPLATQIQLNLVGWKGYDGIQIPRNHNDESIVDLQKVLLAMDALDFKIGPLSSAYCKAELEVLGNIQKLKDIKLWYR